MNVAVMSLTRDRLAYTKHCFGTLLEHAGLEFDWWITDQGSQDGTVDWLLANTDATITAFEENAGICPALNWMLEEIVYAADYDVIVKIDNDCELTTPNTLRDVCARALSYDAILSPKILGLREPPRPVARTNGYEVTPVIGGIFMAVPARVFIDGYRHPTHQPLADGDDWQLCRWWQTQGGEVGYVPGYDAWHYETTDGQWARYPEYFARRDKERVAAGLAPA